MPQSAAGLGKRIWGPGGQPFGIHFGVFWVPSWGFRSKSEGWETLLESILGLAGVWEAKRQQGTGLEVFRLVQGWLGTCK